MPPEADQADVPVTGVPLEAGRLGHPFDRPGQSQLDPADLRTVNLLGFHLDPLRDTEGEALVFGPFKLREAGAAFEEIHKGAVQVPQGLLRGLAVGFLEPFQAGPVLRGRQFQVLDDVRQRFAVLGVVILAAGEPPIVDSAAGSGDATQPLFLLQGRLQSKTVGTAGFHLAVFLLFDVAFDHRQGDFKLVHECLKD